MYLPKLPLIFTAVACWSSAVLAGPGASAGATATPVAQAASPPTLTLSDALAMAMNRSPVLSAARNEAASMEGAVTQAGVLPNPTLDLSVDDTQRSTRTSTAMINVPIELGGKRGARVKAARLSWDASLKVLTATQAEVRSSVIAAFFRVAVAQEKVRVSNDSIDIAQNALSLAEKRVAAGKSPPLERSKAQVELATARIEARGAEAGLRDARRSLGVLWGEAEPTFSDVDVDLSRPPTRPDIDELRASLARAPRLEAGRLAMALSEATLEVEKSKRYADITVSAGVARDNELGRNQPQLGVAIPLPIFDRNQGNVYSAAMQTYKARDAYRELETAITAELLDAISRFDLAVGSLREFREAVLPGALAAYRGARLGFEAGKVGFLEVLDAQRTLSQGSISSLTVLENVYQSASDIDRILGR